MIITTRKTIIDLSKEEKNSIAQTIAILRELVSSHLCEDDYEKLMEGVFENLNDLAETLNTLLANLNNFAPTEEDTEKINW